MAQTAYTIPAIPGYLRREQAWQDDGYTFSSALRASDTLPVIVKTPPRTGDAHEHSTRLSCDFRMALAMGSAIAIQPIALLEHEHPSILVLEDTGLRPIGKAGAGGCGAFETGPFLELAIGIVSVFVQLQRRQVVHGRLKPANIWISPDHGRVKLADFSLAQEYRLGKQNAFPDGQWRGDPRYHAPEQTGRVHAQIDVRTDLYALGITLYELWTGYPPFDFADPLDVVYAHLTQAPVPLHKIREDTPRLLESVIGRLLEKSPEARYQSAAGLLADLNECSAQWKAGGDGAVFALGRHDARGVLETPTGLFGRREEMNRLSAVFERTCEGRKQLCLLAGAPGIGKSRLVQYWSSQARQRGMVLAAKFDQFKKNEPYSLVSQIVLDLARQLLTADDSELADWRSRLREGLGATAGVLVELTPEFAHVIGEIAPPPLLPAAEARTRFNRVVAALMELLACNERRCCLFLDDVQWADEASLDVMRRVIADRRITNLMMLVCYRLDADYDVAGSGLLSSAEGGCELTRIELSGLDEGAVSEFMRATLLCPPDATTGLAQVLLAKTDGNPFFLNQLVTLLHQRGLLTFDAGLGHWQWDIADIEKAPVPDDLIDIIAARLGSLPEGARQALAVAASLGGKFRLRHLSIVCGTDAATLRRDLAPALACGVIRADAYAEGAAVPTDQDDGDQHDAYCFTHDRLQQGAYMLLAGDERKPVHLRIATSLLEGLSADEQLANPFVVIDNLNAASDLLRSDQERLRAAELNLNAGCRARRSAAFAAALSYLKAGIALLDSDAWETQYQLAFDLHSECFECAYIVGAHREAEELFGNVLRHARTSTDKGKIYYTKVLLNTANGQAAEAIEIGRTGLRLFGVHLPDRPRKAALFLELALVRAALGRRSAEDLYELPPMKEAERISTIRLLMSICPAAYFQNPDLMSLAALRIMRLSLKHGNAAPSAFGYVLYGLVLGAVFQRYALGHEFAKLAVRLADKDAGVVLRAKIRMIFAGFVNFWRAPFESSINMLREAYQLAFDSGDVQYANYAILQLLFLKIAKGAPLADVAAELERYGGFITAAGDQFATANYRLRAAYVEVLRGPARQNNIFVRGAFEEEAASSQVDPGNQTTTTYFLILSCSVAVLFGDFHLAYLHGSKAEKKIDYVLSQVMAAEHAFYWGLATVNLMRSGALRHGVGRRILRRCAKRLRLWTQNCEENFAPFAQLLAAEIASLSGLNAVGSLYDNAIQTAAQAGFLHVEGLANESAGRFYSTLGHRTVAAVYLDAATKAFRRWGAMEKVRKLEQSENLIAILPSGAGTHGAGDTGGPALPSDGMREMDAVLRASTQLVGQPASQDLLCSFLLLLAKTTGMERALLLVDNNERLEVVAGVHAGAPMDGTAAPGGYSTHIARYVLRAGEQVCKQSPASDPQFSRCPYLLTARPQSVLCMPLLRASSLVGVVYLESTCNPIAISIERTQAVHALCQHTAVAFENWNDLQRLKDRDGQLRKALRDVAALERIKSQLFNFVPKRVQHIVENAPERLTEESKATDVSVLFLDIAGYTILSERLENTELEELVEACFSAYTTDIHANGGDISEVVGDGLLVLFQDPDPRAHAEAAARTALAIMETTVRFNGSMGDRWPPVVVNIGINSGEVALGFKRVRNPSGDRWTYSATGAVTNIASRIASLAVNGQVLVGEATARRIRTGFVLEPLGAHVLKNVSLPVNVFRVSGATAGAGDA